ncbi:MAG: hypothetical protein DMG32_02130 [Acidobacteria bacterium]|nr:MAG: hypothetical protein DMG32_02130 [Acidobacteriota bacterium]
MSLTCGDYLLWASGSVLLLVVCVFALRRRLYLRLPLFTAYLFLVLLREPGAWWAYYGGYAPRTAFFYYWLTQAVLLAARGAATAEIAWRILRDYRGVWALAWRLLCLVMMVLLVIAAGDSYRNAYWIFAFILTAERGFEVTATVILIALLTLTSYYRIRLEPAQRMVALGLCFYSVVQVLNNSFRLWLPQYSHLASTIHAVSFDVALVIWWLALRKPLPVAGPSPALLQEVYKEFSPQANNQLRELNQRLLEILKL